MARNLDELRDELYRVFNKAAEGVSYPNSSYVQSYPEQTKAAALSVTAAADAANAIINVEREIAERKANGDAGMKMPGK